MFVIRCEKICLFDLAPDFFWYCIDFSIQKLYDIFTS